VSAGGMAQPERLASTGIKANKASFGLKEDICPGFRFWAGDSRRTLVKNS